MTTVYKFVGKIKIGLDMHSARPPLEEAEWSQMLELHA